MPRDVKRPGRSVSKKRASPPPTPDTVRANALIAAFMKASARIESYLHRKEPLTDLQYQTIATTVEGLQTFLLAWKTHMKSH